MSAPQSPLQRDAIGLFCRLVYVALAFLTGVILARNLSLDDFGRYSFASSLIQVAASIALLGMVPLVVREVASHSAAKSYDHLRGILSWATGTALASSSLAIVFLILFGALLKFDTTTTSLLIAGIPLLYLLPQSAVNDAATRGIGRVIAGQLSEFLVRPAVHVGLLASLALGVLPFAFSPLSAMGCYSAAALTAIACSIVVRRASFPKTSKSAVVVVEHEWHQRLWPFALISVLSAVNQQVGMVALGVLGEHESVASLRIATQLSLLVPLGLVAVEAAAAPDMTRKFIGGDVAGLQLLASRSCVASLCAGMPVALALLVFGEEIVRVLFGPVYAASTGPLAIMVVGQLANIAAGAVGPLSVATRNEAVATQALALSVLANAISCVVLIPQFGAYGAAVAVAVSLVTWNAWMILQVARRVGVLSVPSIDALRRLNG